ncbi:GNAT family N-acetyltransferase [Pseudomonas brassicae]|uniref:GNAT family N-acetyltransferase n=1 Tax=Pseudomonas brassicae TaxID=2708063 RepID=UPI00308283D2
MQGLALLADAVPQAFMLLKCGAYLPPWARADAATLHALMVDWRQQGRGLGRCCLEQLPERVREAWPQIGCLQLSVDADNQAALGLYRAAGWVDTGQGYKGRTGYERQMTLVF